MADETPNALPAVAGTIVRSVLVGVGGWFVGKGYFTAEQVSEFAGGAVVLIGALWGVYAKVQAQAKLKAAIAAPAGKAA